MESGRQNPAVSEIYRERLNRRRADVAKGEAIHARLAWTRLALLFIGVALVAVLRQASVPWLVIPLLIFIPLAFYHGTVLNRRDRSARAAAFYERGLNRLEGRWQGTGSTGDRFRDSEHLYADDLDVFGPGSLFELLSTTRTSGGEAVLARWLRAPATKEEVGERQEAVAELAPRLDLREEIAVLGPDIDIFVRTDDLASWAAAPSLLTASWPRIVAPLLAAATTGSIAWWIWSGTPPAALVPSIAVQSLFAWRFRARVHHVVHGVEAREQELEVLAALMARIERDPVTTPLLSKLQGDLRATGRSPAREVRHLARLVDILSSGHNQMFGPLSAVLLLGTQLAFAVEAWRMRCGPAVPRWLAAVGEYEALSSLGTYHAENPDDPFPEVVDGPPLYEGDGLAHPLLDRGHAVPNDVRLGGSHPHLLIVSGSNMSGKSTLLRTVGVNAALAQAGAPVRARRLRMSLLAPGATLRLQDSLQEGHSRFYAEITRLAAIVSCARTTGRALFLCDELLSGTNSHDRLQGSRGILNGLLDLGAIGLVTTHDLALASLAEEAHAPDEPRQRVANVHFADRFDGNTLTFDYKLHPGVVATGNAIPLMRSVGLDV